MAHKQADPTYIPDGYTREGYVAARPGHHGAVRFTYRPMLVEEVDALLPQISKLGTVKFDLVVAKELAKRVIYWDVVTPEGGVLEIKPGTLLRLHPAIFNHVYGIVTGQRGSDVDPERDAREADEELGLELESALTGRSVGEVAEATDTGN